MSLANHELYMQRCYDLAAKAGLEIKTNPKVGAVLVHNDRIIGEGYYKVFGGDHAEVAALKSVKSEDQHLIPLSTMYVSLEPCCITGKTPPCTKAIKRAGIKEVHIGTLDPFPGIQGNGVTELENEGVVVTVYHHDQACTLIHPFCTYHLKKRPFITLKWAQSRDNYIGKEGQRVAISHPHSGLYAHKLRANADAILIGTTTAIVDDPSLTTRHVAGAHPLRLILDFEGKIPTGYQLISDTQPTVIFTNKKRDLPSSVEHVIVESRDHMVKEVLDYCHKNSLVHVMIEGGAKLISLFIKSNLWDQALVIKSDYNLGSGIKAPLLHGRLERKEESGSDTIFHITNPDQKIDLP